MQSCSAYESINAVPLVNQTVLTTPRAMLATPTGIVTTPRRIVAASTAPLAALATNLNSVNNPYLPLTPSVTYYPAYYPPYTWFGGYNYYDYDASRG